MSEGCTDCGRKGGCDHRKAGMFAALDDALGALYPTRRWGERDDAAALERGGGVPIDVGMALADRLAAELKTLALYRPGGPEEYCDYVYALCFGRSPSVLEVREGLAAADAAWDEAAGATPIEELHLRVALSSVVPFAAVQQVTLRMEREGSDLVVSETARTGVFDPILLPRFQKLVAVLAALDIRHIDFGDMTTPPEGFDAGEYPERYGAAPMLANYLFYPQPCASIATTVVPAAGRAPSV